MGLDQYLTADQYVSGYDFSKEKEKYAALLDVFEVSDYVDPDTPSADVSFTVAYWRKANQIHKWFVDNVQNGVDDCGAYEVGREQLRELIRLCKVVLNSTALVDGEVVNGRSLTTEGWQNNVEDGKVLGNTTVAEEVLPSQSGFFFGGTDYDQWYYQDLELTVKYQLSGIFSALSSTDHPGERRTRGNRDRRERIHHRADRNACPSGARARAGTESR